MAPRGRPKKTNDMRTLVNRMLKKRDVMLGGKKVSRRDALIELLWRRVWTTQGKDKTALNALLAYFGGKPVSLDKLPKDENTKTQEDIEFVDKDNYLDKIIAAEQEEESGESGEKK